MNDRICQQWFAKFTDGDFSLIIGKKTVQINNGQFKTLLENNQHYPNQALKIIFNPCVSHFDVWLSHNFSGEKILLC